MLTAPAENDTHIRRVSAIHDWLLWSEAIAEMLMSVGCRRDVGGGTENIL